MYRKFKLRNPLFQVRVKLGVKSLNVYETIGLGELLMAVLPVEREKILYPLFK